MKISSGVSEILLQKTSGSKIKNQKIYLWPEYKHGKVHEISSVKGRKTPYTILNKKNPEEIQNFTRNHSRLNDLEYSGSALTDRKSSSPERGLLFDAIV